MKQPDPDKELTYFSTTTLFDIAKEAYLRSISSKHENQLCNDALVAIVFATSTLEAWISQTIFIAKKWTKKPPKIIEVFANLLGEFDSKETSASLKTKYFMSHWVICGKRLDRGAEPYQSFDLLVDIRNSLIHLKPDKVSIDKIPKLLPPLKSKGLISDFDPKALRKCWVHYISNPHIAKWACNTAASMIQQFVKWPSEDQVKHFFKFGANALHFKPVE